FTISLGGGSIGPPSTVTTDTAGIARSPTWTLGLAGLNTLTATATGPPTLPTLTFSAQAIVSTASSIALNGGDLQTGTVGISLATPYTVVVKDLAGLPVAGVPVSWAVAPNSGARRSAEATTNRAGGATR